MKKKHVHRPDTISGSFGHQRCAGVDPVDLPSSFVNLPVIQVSGISSFWNSFNHYTKFEVVSSCFHAHRIPRHGPMLSIVIDNIHHLTLGLDESNLSKATRCPVVWTRLRWRQCSPTRRLIVCLWGPLKLTSGVGSMERFLTGKGTKKERKKEKKKKKQPWKMILALDLKDKNFSGLLNIKFLWDSIQQWIKDLHWSKVGPAGLHMQ